MDKQTIKQLGTLLFSIEEAKLIMTPDDEINDMDTMHKKGELVGEVEIRKALFKAEKNGDKGAIAQWQVMKSKAKHENR